ncbi:MAG: hypothetical protein OEV59_01570 [Deltaproteobacteria bacterium]|nr:hypothetical protein [Deltaproteobacteria bacterium]
MKKLTKANTNRKVHITLPEETHQQLRIKCAIKDITIQEFVAHLIEDSVSDIEVIKNGNYAQREN